MVNCLNLHIPLKKLNFSSGKWFNLFVDFKFECVGAVLRWEFYALQSGSVYVSVWRHQSDNNAKLVGKNKLIAPQAGNVVRLIMFRQILFMISVALV